MTGARRQAGAAIAFAGFLILATAGAALAAAPANDERSGAIAVELFGGASFDLQEATTAPDDPAPCTPGGTEERSVWFSYKATEAGPTLIAVAANDDVAFHVFASDGTTELGCADAGFFKPPTVEVDAVVDDTYLIEVASRKTFGTLGSIAVERPLVVTTAIPTTGHVNSAGDAIFQVTYECSQDITVETEIDLVQGFGSNATNGSQLQTDNCHAPGTVITLIVKANDFSDPNARFHRGQAAIFFQWAGFSFSQVVRDTVKGTVELTGGPSIAAPQTDVAPMGAVAPEVPGLAASTLAALVALSATAAGLALRRLRRSRGTGAGTSA